jgi:hypothetical protein
MEHEEIRPVAGVVDRQILLLLQQHRRLTFLALAYSLPTYSWRALFMSLNRLCRAQHVELMPLAGDYEVVWRHWREERVGIPGEPCLHR